MSWRWDKKTTVEECRSLWASNFHKWGIFKANVSWTGGMVSWKNAAGEIVSSVGYTFSQQPRPRLTLSYTITRSATGEKQDFNYDIELATTPCRYGGLRYWFICPLIRNGCPCRPEGTTTAAATATTSPTNPARNMTPGWTGSARTPWLSTR